MGQGSTRPTPAERAARSERRSVRVARDLIAAVGGSVGFDHAVEYYDETRGLSPEVQAQIAELLSAEFAAADEVLEVGAGTGLVTLPLARHGLPVQALDVSLGMLQRLVHKARKGGLRVPAVVGDATRLPFRDDSVDGVAMRHVLHLVSNWEAALAEVARIVRPEGRFVVSITDYTGLYHAMQARFLHAAGDLPIAVGLRPDDPASLDAAMEALGATGRLLPVVRGRRTLTISAFLWAASSATRKQAVAEVRRWAKAEMGDLHRPVEPEFEIEWRSYRFA
jgi:ubiquinone/menaquinone biosynthesis C-methylase UbiE